MRASLRIAYFVHDLTDPAVGRRVRMLKAAGADVVVIGFRRRDETISDVHGACAIDLGRTHDSRFAQRAFKVLQQRLRLSRWWHDVGGADVLIARNLEMLVLAAAARRSRALHAGLVYECLDLHRLLLSNGIAGKLLRLLERRLMQKIRLLIISSPAFSSEYFAPRQGINREARVPVLLVENKMLDLDANSSATRTPTPAALPSGPPWRIGWFGMIRCRKSLDILCALAAQRPGLVEVVIRGVARGEFPLAEPTSVPSSRTSIKASTSIGPSISLRRAPIRRCCCRTAFTKAAATRPFRLHLPAPRRGGG
jgi:hypothetical protein